MAKKLSIIVLGDSGTTSKRYFISHGQLIAMSVGLIVAVVAVVSCLFQYASFQSRIAQKHIVENQLRHKTAEVEQQRRQIQQFANKINDIKQKLLALNQLEDKIRTIANIDSQDNPENLFSVGGSMPDDLNADVEISNNHHLLIKDMHRQIKQINDVSLNQLTTFETLLTKLEEQKNLLAHTPSIRPALGRVSSRFGYRKSPFGEALEFHKGLDIANQTGTPIVAPADGMVSYVGLKGTFGQMMVIDHGFGITTRYAHIEEGLKKPGEMVSRGDQIALMGNTGRSTGAHLHYEVRLHGVPINPDNYISD